MPQLLLKSGDRLVVEGNDEDIVLLVDRVCDGCVCLTVDTLEGIRVKRRKGPQPDADIQDNLTELTKKIITLVSETDAAASQDVLTQFVSDLFYALAQKRQKEERRQKQAEGIARARIRGVRLGRAADPLPDNFGECYQAWQRGAMTATEAARVSGISRKKFYNVVNRVRESGECAV